MADQGVSLRLNRVLVDSTAPPKSMHRIMWTRVGDMIVLELGHFDLAELRQVINAHKELQKPDEKPADVNFFVTDRFFVTPSIAKELHNDLDGLVNDLQMHSIIPPKEGGD